MIEDIIAEVADTITNAYITEKRQLSIEEADHIDFLFKRAETEMEVES